MASDFEWNNFSRDRPRVPAHPKELNHLRSATSQASVTVLVMALNILSNSERFLSRYSGDIAMGEGYNFKNISFAVVMIISPFSISAYLLD